MEPTALRAPLNGAFSWRPLLHQVWRPQFWAAWLALGEVVFLHQLLQDLTTKKGLEEEATPDSCVFSFVWIWKIGRKGEGFEFKNDL